MRALGIIFSIFFSMNSMACQFSIIEQEGRFYLILKRVGELPSSEEKIKKKLRRGFQEVEIENADSDTDKIQSTDLKVKRKARIRVIHDSENKEEMERVLKSRCANSTST